MKRRAEVLPFLARVRDRFAVPMLYVTHALDEVDRLADLLVLMEAGRVLASGSVEELSLRTDLPLAVRRDAGAVLPCTVLSHDPARGLTRLGFAGASPHRAAAGGREGGAAAGAGSGAGCGRRDGAAGANLGAERARGAARGGAARPRA